mmetsp:Transcript_22430/g.40757  ORF Transcript_22430/g.40757 Transcript_22430/m.40757 type:complete len:396 (-) Transcript_22430:544-1731(-)
MIPNWYIPIATVIIFTMVAFMFPTPDPHPNISVAFVGNSMQYFNDFPRLMQALSNGTISQNSCLHGDATIRTLLHTGNGMARKFKTANAVVDDADLYVYNNMDDDTSIVIHDYGACTVRQLLIGEDSRLPDQDQVNNYADDYFNPADDDNEYYIDDGTNPCFEDEYYLSYLESRYKDEPPKWDYIVINDNTRSPARNNTRQRSLEELEASYVPWLWETGATPVFIVTHAYWTGWRDMSGLEDVPTFTSLTYMGYREYAALLEKYLPPSQKPRLAPVAIAFLTVWEENYPFWLKLFHIDEVHASPLGSYLQGCVVYHTLYGRMPPKEQALRQDMSNLWLHARRMQPDTHRSNPFPTLEQATYLYHVADRVCKGHFPKSLIVYQNGEASDYVEKEYD